MANRPYESRVQNLVYTLEVGVGATVFKALLYVLFMMLLAVLYVATQYAGFNNARAMDQAQLARRFAETGQFHTANLSPAALGLMARNGRLMVETETGAIANLHAFPDIVNPPVYPLMLGTAFRLFRTPFPTPTGQRFAPEQWVIIPINLLLVFLTALLLYTMGRMLFDARTALTATTIFLLSGSIWAQAVGGTEFTLALFLGTLAFWCLTFLLRTVRTQDGQLPQLKGAGFWIPLVIGSLSLALLFLTRYAAWTLLPGFLLVLWVGCGRKGWLPALLALLIFAAPASLWILRNLRASGEPFGLTPTLIHQDVHDTMLRSLDRSTDPGEFRRMIQARFIQVIPRALTLGGIPMSAGISFALFLGTYFYRFQRPVPRILRWGALLSLLLLILSAGIFGEALLDLGQLLLPLILLFGCAFFYILLDRLQIGVKIVSLSIVSLFVLLQALPMLFTIMPPRPGSYPPYMAGDIGLVTAPFQRGELMVSDMPWATAWYGGVTSLLLPVTVDEFFHIHDRLHPVHGMYITLLTRDKRHHSDLSRGPLRSWRPIIDLAQLPRGFPLTYGFPIRNSEVILADRNRWLPETQP